MVFLVDRGAASSAGAHSVFSIFPCLFVHVSAGELFLRDGCADWSCGKSELVRSLNLKSTFLSCFAHQKASL